MHALAHRRAGIILLDTVRSDPVRAASGGQKGARLSCELLDVTDHRLQYFISCSISAHAFTRALCRILFSIQSIGLSREQSNQLDSSRIKLLVVHQSEPYTYCTILNCAVSIVRSSAAQVAITADFSSISYGNGMNYTSAKITLNYLRTALSYKLRVV